MLEKRGLPSKRMSNHKYRFYALFFTKIIKIGEKSKSVKHNIHPEHKKAFLS